MPRVVERGSTVRRIVPPTPPWEKSRADREAAERQRNAARKVWLDKVKTEGGLALYLAPDPIKADKGIVLAAVSQNGDAYYFASAALQADKEVVQAMAQSKGTMINHAPDAFASERSVVLAAVHQDGYALSSASAALRADREVAMAAALNTAWALQYVDDSLTTDYDFMLEIVRAYDGGDALQFAPLPMQRMLRDVLARDNPASPPGVSSPGESTPRMISQATSPNMIRRTSKMEPGPPALSHAASTPGT